MRKVMQKMLLASVALGFTAMAANAATNSLPGYSGEIPELSTQLNDIPGDLPVGEYIQYIATNEISTAVVLTNGVLTVGTNSIAISPAQHTVITTNGMNVVTNTYDAVFQDQLTNAISIATNALDNVIKTIVTTNWIDESTFTTNVITVTNHIAYTYDVVMRPIDPDDTKADKVLKVWDFYMPRKNWLLKMNYTVGEQPSVITWDDPISLARLGYDQSNGLPWFFSAFGETVFTSGKLNDKVVTFYPDGENSFDLIATNHRDVAFVVYSDYLASNYVDKASMGYVAGALTNLDTVTGIHNALQDMKQRLYDIAGGYSTRARLSNIARGNAVRIGAVEMATSGDLVDIDWGDGTIYSATNLPAYHVYTNDMPQATIGIRGRIRSISGEDGLSWITIADDMARRASWSPIGDKLESVEFGHSVGIEELGKNAFLGCNKIASLDFIPNTVTKLGDGCFSYCSGLSSLRGLPTSVSRLPNRCFENSGVLSFEDMTTAIESLGDFCFRGCPIESINGIPSSVATIGAGCFSDCSSLSSIDGLSNLFRVTEVPPLCFANTALESIRFSEYPSITGIGEMAFSGNALLTDVFITENITSIGSNAFQGDPIADIEFDWRTISDVENMDSFPWGITSSPTKYTCLDGWLDVNGGSSVTNYTVIALTMKDVRQGTTFRIGGIESTGANVSVDWGYANRRDRVAGHRMIPEGELRHTYNFSSDGLATTNVIVKIYGGIGAIHAYDNLGFIQDTSTEGNPYLTGIEFGAALGLRSIGDSCFKYSTNLNVIVSYSDGAFSAAELPSTLVSIGASAFEGCSGLVQLPMLPTSGSFDLGDRCFANCTSLTDLFPISSTGMTEIPDGCFSNCIRIASLDGKLPNSLTSIGDYAFAGCVSLTSLQGIPSGVNSLGVGCFENNPRITTLGGLPNSLSEIPPYCFAGCTGLVSLADMPSSVEQIGTYAFAGDFYVTNTVVVGILPSSSLQDDCFYNMGMASLTNKMDQFGGYNSTITFSGMSCAEVIAAGIQMTGVPASTRIYCKDGSLYGTVNQHGMTEWIAFIKSFDLTIDVPNDGMVFAFSSIDRGTNTISIYWGDGYGTDSVSTVKYTDSLSAHKHKFAEAGIYTIEVSGNISGIGGDGDNGRPFFFCDNDDSDGNPYITDFRLYYAASSTNIGYTGINRLNSYCFFGCSNLASLAGLSVPKSRGFNSTSWTIFGSEPIGFRSSSSDVESPIVALGSHCFQGCSSLVDFNGLPKVKTLPSYCFADCTGITSLESLPNSITVISDHCFAGCTELVNLKGLPNISNIADSSFEGCIGLNDLDYMSSLVSNIGISAFAECKNMKSLLGMDGNVMSLGHSAFMGTGLTDLEYMSQSIDTIPNSAFSRAESLRSLYGISTNVLDIGQFAFEGCTNLTEVNDMPESVTNFQRYSFAQALRLTNGVMGAYVTSIGENFMLNAGSLVPSYTDIAGITVPTRIYSTNTACETVALLMNSSSNINKFVEFVCRDGYVVCATNEWNSMFKTVVIEMENVARGSRFRIGEITSYSNMPIIVDWGDGNIEEYYKGIGHTYNKKGNYTVELNGFALGIKASKDVYPFLTSGGNGNTNIITVSIGEATKIGELGDYCFKGCKNLKTLNGKAAFTRFGGLYHSPVAILGKECFAGCSSLTNLFGLPPAVSRFGDGCFSDCTSLASLSDIPTLVETIPTNCFSGCVSINSLSTLPETVQAFKSGCFRGCTGLKDLNGMPKSTDPDIDVEDPIEITVEDGVFEDCTGITNLTGYGANYLAARLFKGCRGIVDLTGLPVRIDSIPAECFSGCTSLTRNSVIPTNVISIGDRAFSGCTGLSNMEPFGYVQTIGVSAFESCSNIVSLSGFTDRLKSIGDYAFASNMNIIGFGSANSERSLYSSNASFSVGSYAFAGCRNFGKPHKEFIDIPSGITELGEGAFEGCDMSGAYTFPETGLPISSRLFASTRLTNIWINVNSVGTIASNAFINSRTEHFTYGGLETDRIIYLPSLYAKDVSIYPNFPFGCSTNTRFIAFDGSVVYHNTNWVSLVASMEISITVTAANNSVTISRLIPHDEHGYCISWGDQTFANWCERNRSQTHTYKTPGSYTISILRGIDAIDDTFTSNSPFIYGSNFYVYDIYMNPEAGIKKLGRRAFKGMSRITVIPEIPQSVSIIGDECFSGCSGILDVSGITTSITNLGKAVFSGCSGVTNVSLSFPLITEIPDNTFYGCHGLSNVVFSGMENVTRIGNSAFELCDHIEYIGLSSILPNVEHIGDKAFGSCTRLLRLELPSSATNISTTAFTNLGSERTEQFEDSAIADTLSQYTLHSTYKYKSIVLVDGRSCSSITNGLDLGYNEREAMWDAPITVRFMCKDGDIVWYGMSWKVAYGSLAFYIDTSDALPDGICTLRFSGYENTTNIVVWGDGNSSTNFCRNDGDIILVTNKYHATTNYSISVRGRVKEIIGLKSGGQTLPCLYYVNGGNTNLGVLTACTIAKNSKLARIGDYAFYGCSNILYVLNLDTTYSSIGKSAFEGCSSLVNFISPESITEVGDNAFRDCISISTIELPKSGYVTIGSNVVYGCTNLMNIVSESPQFPKMNDSSLSGTGLKFLFVAENVQAISINSEYEYNDYVRTGMFGLSEIVEELIGIKCADGTIWYNNYNDIAAWWITRQSIEIDAVISSQYPITIEKPVFADLNEQIETRSMTKRGDHSGIGATPAIEKAICDAQHQMAESGTGWWSHDHYSPVPCLPKGNRSPVVPTYVYRPPENVVEVVSGEPNPYPTNGMDFSDATSIKQICTRLRKQVGATCTTTNLNTSTGTYDALIIIPGEDPIVIGPLEFNKEWYPESIMKKFRALNNKYFKQESSAVVNMNIRSISDIIAESAKKPVYGEMKVFWGDGTYTISQETPYGCTHQYKTNGVYHITISGNISGLNGGTDELPFINTTVTKTWRAPPPKDYIVIQQRTERCPVKVLSIKIHDGMGLSYIGANCFSWLTEMTNCILSSTIKQIGEKAFKGTVLKDISCISNLAVTNIPDYCFMCCTNIRNLVGMPQTVTSIGKESFAANGEKMKFYLGSDIFEWDKGAPSFSTKLTSLNGISPNIEHIGDGSFRGSSITSIPLELTSLTKIGPRAFMDTNLKSGIGLTAITEVSESSFENSKMTDIYWLPTSITSLPERCFAGCPFTKGILVPNWVSELSVSTFGGTPFLWDKSRSDRDTIRFKGTAFKIDVNCLLKDFLITRGERNSIHSNFTYMGYAPLMKIKMSSKNVGGSVTLGRMDRDVYLNETVFIDWGDGTHTNLVAKPSTITHAFRTPNSGVITICGGVGGVSSIGGDGFVRLDGTSSTVKEIEFTDCLGLKRIGDNSFNGVGAVKCVATIQIADGTLNHAFNLPTPNYRPYTTYALQHLKGFPWGCARDNVKGIERKSGSHVLNASYNVTSGGSPLQLNRSSYYPIYYMCYGDGFEYIEFQSPRDSAIYTPTTRTIVQVRHQFPSLDSAKAHISWATNPDPPFEAPSAKLTSARPILLASGNDHGDASWYWGSPWTVWGIEYTWAEEVPGYTPCYAITPYNSHYKGSVYITGLSQEDIDYINTTALEYTSGTTIVGRRNAPKRRGSAKRGISTDDRTGFLNSAIGARRGATTFQFTEFEYMPVDTNKVEDYAFYNNVYMTNMPPMPESVVEIGSHAFENTQIGNFGIIPDTITNFGDRAFASYQIQEYEITFSATNMTMGVDVFGEHYPFGVSKKTVRFPNITTNALMSIANFPFAKMVDKALDMEVYRGYTNEYTTYECKGGVRIHPVVTGTDGQGKAVWEWLPEE